MANRVVLDNSRLSISMPGYDVLTASVGDMIFDSRYGEFGGVVMTGTATGQELTIPFGRTLPRVPIVWVAYQFGQLTQQMGSVSERHNGNSSSGGSGAAATTTELKIFNYGGGAVRYIVFSVGST